MPEEWIDPEGIARQLREFFFEEKAELSRFGSTVNQVFEAYVFASTAARYRSRGWNLVFRHPPRDDGGAGGLRLKFSTRGRPAAYSYVECVKRGHRVQVRHQLRVATYFHEPPKKPPANIVLDVAVVRQFDDTAYRTDDALPNEALVTFGEAKHMSAFAELVASFIGVVHEMQPFRLGRGRSYEAHPKPFLFVSGFMYRTGEGVVRTVMERGYDVEFFSRRFPPAGAPALPLKAANRAPSTSPPNGSR
jgi:hypothetical protein